MTLLTIPRESASTLDQNRWFAEEVQPHETALRNWLRVRFPTVHDRDDVVQEAFLRVWRARVVGPIHAPKAFLFATARNLVLDALKQAGPQIDLGESRVLGVLDERCNTAESVARAQELEDLQAALASLPERCREVFTLRRIHGLSQKEIAARLGISEKTVEAQNCIAMHKCVQFFERQADQAMRSPRSAAEPVFRAIPVAPQHA